MPLQLPAIGAEVPQPGGPLVAGNIDLSTRPRVQNPDGSTSTVRSLSFEQDGKEILVPTVVEGRVVSDDAAIAHYKKTGQHLGIFATSADATAFAQQLHASEARKLELPPIGGEVGAIVPDFRATNEPPSTALKAAAYGKDALQLALDALPGAGAVIGGVIATPETAGAGTLAGAALGAGAGRGLRDLIAAGLGLQKPSTAIAEGGKIALDVGETYLAGKVLPALWEAIKQPGATVADVVDRTKTLYAVLPKALKAFLPDVEALAKLPKGVGKAPAAILERPAWQTWQEHLPEAQPSPQVARTTGTSMIPAAVPAPIAPAPTPPAATRVVPMAPSAAAPAATEFTAARAARQASNTLPDQKALNEAALLARRQAYAESQKHLAAQPIVAASGKMQLTGPEMQEFSRLIAKGMTLPDALAEVKAMRDLAAKLGGVTAAEAKQAIAARRYKS